MIQSITLERRFKYPTVMAIFESARQDLLN
jgi:hypothetical protein